MKNVFRIIGIILIVVMIGFVIASCNDGSCGHCLADPGKCGFCWGTGKLNEDDCTYCNGSGKCKTCDGTGKDK